MNRPARDALSYAASMAVAGTLLLLLGTPATWLGGALLYGALSLVYRSHGEQCRAALKPLQTTRQTRFFKFVPGRLALEALYIVLIVGLASVMLSDVFSGERPVSHDHTVHYFKALHMHRHLLPAGQVMGWNSRMFAGYPAGYLYPIGADLWVNLCHALGLGFVSFSRAYGLAFLAFFALFGVAGYRFGRMLGGPHVGFITAVLLLTDLSDFRLGGFIYTVDFGVWPQALSLAFALLGLCHLPAIFEERRLSPVAAFGLWMGLSAITHPMVIIFLALLWPIAGAANALSGAKHTFLGLCRLTAACGLGLLSASLWLIPFFSTKAHTNAMGVFWDTTYEMGRGLVTLTTFNGTLGYVLAFGIPAVVISARSRSFRLLFAAIVAVAVPMVTSSSWVDELHLTALHTAFAKVQYLRMATMVKPFWFALCGLLIVGIARAIPQLLSRFEQAAPWSRRAERGPVAAVAFSVLFALVSLPLLVGAGEAFYVDHVGRSIRTVHDRTDLKDRQDLQRYLLSHLPKDGFYRLGIFMGHNHDLFDMAAELDVPMYKRGFTPCANFIFKMQSEERDVLDAVKVRYAISKSPPAREDFELERRFGVYGLYRYTRYTPDPFTVIGGQGPVHLTRFEDEHIALRAGEGASGTLQLAVSYFPRWHAYRDGQEVPIALRSLSGEAEKTGFMTVPLAPGQYDFRFERTLSDRLALPLSALGFALCLGIMVVEARRRRPLLMDIQENLGSWPRALGRRPTQAIFGVTALAMAGGFIGLSQMRPALKPDPEANIPSITRVHYDFLEHLDDAQARFRYRDRDRSCRRVLGQLLCPNSEGDFSSDRYVGSQPTTIEEYRMVRCIRARPEQAAILSIQFPRVPRGQALVGYYGMDYEGRLLFYKRPVRFNVSIDDKIQYGADTERDNHMHWFRVDVPAGETPAVVRFDISSTTPYKRWFCFQAQMVDLK